jgi:hypothetical protein
MPALSAIRDTEKLDSSLNTLHGFPQKASTKAWFGALMVLSAGYAAPGTTATGLVAIGRCRKTSDNSSGANGDQNVQVEAGTFKWDNSSAGDLIAQADVGAQCYIVDDHTVAKTNGSITRSVAGIIQAVDADGGVWVQTGLGINS